MLLKSLDRLSLVELKFERKHNNKLGIEENCLEKYLIDNNYNVYSNEDVDSNDLFDKDLTADSVLIIDTMIDLGLDTLELEDETYWFYFSNEDEARYLEIVQNIVGNEKDIEYTVIDSEDGELFSNIYITDLVTYEKTKAIYSFENDDYVVIKDEDKVKLTYTDEMKQFDVDWDNDKEDYDTACRLFKEIEQEAKEKGCTLYFNISDYGNECVCELYESEEEFTNWNEDYVELSYGRCDALIESLENIMTNMKDN